MTLFEIARIFFALLAVLGMIGALAIAAKRYGLAQKLQGRAEKRLRLVETLALDQRRRAAIIACDGREHLVILDPSGVTVVETGVCAHRREENAAANLKLVRPEPAAVGVS